MCYDHWKENDGDIVMELDYLERYQPVPMREIQSENFAKDADVSMEIRIVSYQGKIGRSGFSTNKACYVIHDIIR